MKRIWIVAALSLIAAACGEDLAPGEDTGAGGSNLGDQVVHLEETAGTRLTRIDARNTEAWVYLDLDRAEQTDEKGGWDLAFQRMAVISNGGASGDGQVAVARIEGRFDEVEGVPASGFVEDAADGADDDELPDSAFLSPDPWYAYDMETHTLTPQERVFVVRSTEGAHFKLVFTGYYDEVGSSGYPTFRWSALEGEEPERPVHHLLEIDASDAEAFVAIDLRAGKVVAVEDLAASEAWDLALRRTAVRTNGGTSGPGEAAAAEAEEATLDGIVAPPAAEAFQADELMTSGRPGEEPSSGNPVLSTWFDYDMGTHTITPRDARFVLRTADGGLAKLEILDWADGVFTIDCVVAAPGAERF